MITARTADQMRRSRVCTMPEGNGVGSSVEEPAGVYGDGRQSDIQLGLHNRTVTGTINEPAVLRERERPLSWVNVKDRNTMFKTY